MLVNQVTNLVVALNSADLAVLEAIAEAALVADRVEAVAAGYSAAVAELAAVQLLVVAGLLGGKS